jgi:hypothetical protein
MFWLKWAEFGAKIINFKMRLLIWILAHKFWVKAIFLYQYLFYNLLAYQQAQKHPKKLTMAKIMTIFLKWSKIDYFPFFQLVLNIFVQNVHYLRALRKSYYMINISNFYFGNKNFRPPNFGRFLAFIWKLKTLVSQQIPNGISCSIPCWKAIDV